MVERVVVDGSTRRVDAVDRGAPLHLSEEGYWRRRHLYILSALGLAVFTAVNAWFSIFALWWVHSVHVFSVTNVVLLVLCLLWASQLVPVLLGSAPHRLRPGVYARGVQLMDGTFVPFEEIKEASRRRMGLQLTIMLVALNRSGSWYLPLDVAPDGVPIINNAVNHREVRSAAPTMVVYPRV